MSFVCRYWFQTVGWRISNEKLKSGQFALMSTIVVVGMSGALRRALRMP